MIGKQRDNNVLHIQTLYIDVKYYRGSLVTGEWNPDIQLVELHKEMV